VYSCQAGAEIQQVVSHLAHQGEKGAVPSCITPAQPIQSGKSWSKRCAFNGFSIFGSAPVELLLGDVQHGHSPLPTAMKAGTLCPLLGGSLKF
jgi:hypothetical protein